MKGARWTDWSLCLVTRSQDTTSARKLQGGPFDRHVVSSHVHSFSWQQKLATRNFLLHLSACCTFFFPAMFYLSTSSSVWPSDLYHFFVMLVTKSIMQRVSFKMLRYDHVTLSLPLPPSPLPFHSPVYRSWEHGSFKPKEDKTEIIGRRSVVEFFSMKQKYDQMGWSPENWFLSTGGKKLKSSKSRLFYESLVVYIEDRIDFMPHCTSSTNHQDAAGIRQTRTCHSLWYLCTSELRPIQAKSLLTNPTYNLKTKPMENFKARSLKLKFWALFSMRQRAFYGRYIASWGF